MRFTLISGALFALLSWMALQGGAIDRPSAEIITLAAALPGPQAATVYPLPDPNSGAAALSHIARPDPDTQPILPDIPKPLSRPNMDQPVLYPTGGQEGIGLLQELELVATRGSNAPGAASPIAAVEDDRDLAQTIARRLVMREGPAKRHDRVAVLDYGTDIQITGAREGGYYPVAVGSSGTRGWVFHRYIKRVN